MNFENQYSLLDKWLHRFSFFSSGAQAGLADIEDRLYATGMAKAKSDRAVFVTALPRAGTTVLLNLLVGTGEFASHTYRDMPFVICPLLWQRFSQAYRKESIARERAHGDGLSVSLDSPEALEEMVWKPFWPSHYRADRISPWKHCNDPQFQVFFKNHMRKIIALRFPSSDGHHRYASKNNLNIARIKAIPQLLPDSTVLVMFRKPLQHAASLLQQHQLFLAMHKRDKFSRRYMEGTGHFDFGENLRPINFNAWLDEKHETNPLKLAFWLEYWLATYRHVLAQKGDTVKLLSFDTLTAQPTDILGQLTNTLGLSNADLLTRQATQLHPAGEHAVDTTNLQPSLLAEAQELHAELLRHSLVAGDPGL